MKDLVLWLIMLVAYFTYTFPPLVCSKTSTARITRCILSIVIGGTIGFGIGSALTTIL